jgi:predicted ester cyclase
MTTEDSKRQVLQFLEAVSGTDKPPELLAQYVLDEELIEHVRVFEAAFPRYEITADDVISEGNRVAVRATVRARHQGSLMGIEPTGREIVQSGLVLYELENGKIVRHWRGFDGLELLRQLGAGLS